MGLSSAAELAGLRVRCGLGWAHGLHSRHRYDSAGRRYPGRARDHPAGPLGTVRRAAGLVMSRRHAHTSRPRSSGGPAASDADPRGCAPSTAAGSRPRDRAAPARPIPRGLVASNAIRGAIPLRHKQPSSRTAGRCRPASEMSGYSHSSASDNAFRRTSGCRAHHRRFDGFVGDHRVVQARRDPRRHRSTRSPRPAARLRACR